MLTANWHVVRPTMQDCTVALCLRGQGRPRQVHYITSIKTDWAQDGVPCMLMSGWPGPAHMPLIHEQMWSTDPELSLPLFPLSALHTASSQACCPADAYWATSETGLIFIYWNDNMFGWGFSLFQMAFLQNCLFWSAEKQGRKQQLKER